MYEFFEDEKRYFIIQEVIKGDELFDELLQRGTFSEKSAALIAKQLISCMNYCHLNNIVHRDLKLENILVDDMMNLKVADFGLARSLDTRDPD